jgi:hypothetical protein
MITAPAASIVIASPAVLPTALRQLLPPTQFVVFEPKNVE